MYVYIRLDLEEKKRKKAECTIKVTALPIGKEKI